MKREFDELERELLDLLPEETQKRVATRAALSARLDEAREAMRKAQADLAEAKGEIFSFDKQFPEAMQAYHAVVGGAKRQRKQAERAAAEGDGELVTVHEAHGDVSIPSAESEGN